MIKEGIDISHWNKVINYDRIASAVDFVILKAGGSDGRNKKQYRDVCFEKNYQALHERGVPLGAYYFVGRHCINGSVGRYDADHFLSLLNGKQFEYPVVCDLESTSTKDRAGATEAVIEFCNTLEKNGYYAMIYASDVSGFIDRLELGKLTRFDKWVARYGNKPKFVKDYGIWQRSSKGHIDGLAGYIDLDEAYIDYPAIMKRKHLNNC